MGGKVFSIASGCHPELVIFDHCLHAPKGYVEGCQKFQDNLMLQQAQHDIKKILFLTRSSATY